MSRRRCGRPVLAGPTPHGEVDGINIDGCAYPRLGGKQRCAWHWLLAQPADIQKRYAAQRLEHVTIPNHRARVPASEWPPGERWCAGCRSFVPLFYCRGSRCIACASAAAHEQRVQRVYGLESGEYDELFRLQGGRCFICQRRPGTKRLAVDHDHETGRPRGLLCASNEHGCNRAILGNIRDIAMARRIMLYLAVTPYDRMKGQPALSWEDYVKAEAARILQERAAGPRPVRQDPPPF